MFTGGADDANQWTDYDQAKEYLTQLTEDGCTLEDDSSCFYAGCRWSVIYNLNGVTMLLIAANTILLTVGVWSFHARALGACCSSALCCLNVACIITTAVFRFNTWGSLAALSTMNVKYDSSSDSGLVYPPTFSDS